jgi:hypothetical protein
MHYEYAYLFFTHICVRTCILSHVCEHSKYLGPDMLGWYITFLSIRSIPRHMMEFITKATFQTKAMGEACIMNGVMVMVTCMAETMIPCQEPRKRCIESYTHLL